MAISMLRSLSYSQGQLNKLSCDLSVRRPLRHRRREIPIWINKEN